MATTEDHSRKEAPLHRPTREIRDLLLYDDVAHDHPNLSKYREDNRRMELVVISEHVRGMANWKLDEKERRMRIDAMLEEGEGVAWNIAKAEKEIRQSV